MSTITASVGRNGVNRAADVRTIQTLMNRHRRPGDQAIAVTGVANPETIAAIEEFQRRVVGLPNPDGRVDPDGRTLKALNIDTANLSGATWWHTNQARFPNSSRIEDLEPVFRAKFQEFLAALRAAGAITTIFASRRNKQRAYLMHYCFKIANGSTSPADVPTEPGMNIIWDHGDLAKSRQAAKEMVQLFGIVFQPSLESLHITGQAVDIDISWSGLLSIRAKGGQTFRIDAPRNGSNTLLHTVGASYGVIKLLSDPPHWSVNGH